MLDKIVLLDRSDIADYLDIPLRKLTYILYGAKVESFYTEFEIPKKNGEFRTISAPNKELKEIQQKLADKIYDLRESDRQHYPILKKVSYGFEKKSSILSNASIHRNKRYIFSVDLKDFFNCFHFGRVRGFFFHCKYYHISEEAATVLAQLCCYKGQLPQGAPTSPVITNSICVTMDKSIARLASKYRLYYTRYADDLTFSTNDKKFLERKDEFTQKLEEIICKSGFFINQDKTRLALHDSRQMVTGLVVNKRVSVSRDYYKITRAMLDSYMKKQECFINGESASLNQLEGRISFLDQVERYNRYIEYVRSISKSENETTTSRNLKKLNTRERTIQKFLFYKYFFGREKPLIVTEGPSDIVHLRCAFLTYKDEYPKLVKVDENGKANFGISFLNRRKSRSTPSYYKGIESIKQLDVSCLERYLGLSADGADTMSKFYKNYYKSNGLYDSFIEKGCKDGEPVIFIFDNEMKGERPIRKFMNELPNPLAKQLEQNGAVKIRNNLFAVAIPLVEGEEECEIEDLYDQEIRKTRVNGKEFNRDSKFNNDKYYGKEKFAEEVIAKNYKSINFKRFKPLLKVINSIIIKHDVNE